MIGGCVRDFGECSCNCHRWPEGSVKHIVACCQPCRFCGKNISYSLAIHEEQCKADWEKTVEEMAGGWLRDGKRVLTDEEVEYIKKNPKHPGFPGRFKIP